MLLISVSEHPFDNVMSLSQVFLNISDDTCLNEVF